MATSDKQNATKKDLENVRTELKKDIQELRKNMATKDDLRQSEDNNAERMEALFIKYKSEFIDYIDPILKEVKDSREERTIQATRISNHEDRLEALEVKLHITSN